MLARCRTSALSEELPFLGHVENGSFSEPRNTLAPRPEDVQLGSEAQRLILSMLANENSCGKVSICLIPVSIRRTSNFDG